jgi:hypothetical protein
MARIRLAFFCAPLISRNETLVSLTDSSFDGALLRLKNCVRARGAWLLT